MKKEVTKNKKCVRALYKGGKDRALLWRFNSKKDAQNFFELKKRNRVLEPLRT